MLFDKFPGTMAMSDLLAAYVPRYAHMGFRDRPETSPGHDQALPPTVYKASTHAKVLGLRRADIRLTITAHVMLPSQLLDAVGTPNG
jgi:hypothetical protein